MKRFKILGIFEKNTPKIMYYPYLRGKQFELYAIEKVLPLISHNTIPIIEPVTKANNAVANNTMVRIANAGNVIAVVVNPEFGSLTEADVQSHLINGILNGHQNIILVYRMTFNSTSASLAKFFAKNNGYRKAVLFRANFMPAELTNIVNVLRANASEFIGFDSAKTSFLTQHAFAWHPTRVLITDAFQAQVANKHYPKFSPFAIDFANYKVNGWSGIGDYQTVGDIFRESGGPVYVVALHATNNTKAGLIVEHYTSTVHDDIQGLAPEKFAEACEELANSKSLRGLKTAGMDMFRDWHAKVKFPTLGAAKQASIMNHMEVMSRLV